MGGPCSGKVSPTVQLLLSGSNYNPERGTGNRVLAERRMALSKDGCRWRHSPPPWLHPASASACSPPPPPHSDSYQPETVTNSKHWKKWSPVATAGYGVFGKGPRDTEVKLGLARKVLWHLENSSESCQYTPWQSQDPRCRWGLAPRLRPASPSQRASDPPPVFGNESFQNHRSHW